MSVAQGGQMAHSRKEVEEAFKKYYFTGPVGEDWKAWSELFTDDAWYKDHYWGTFHGPAEIEKFLDTTMSFAPGVYTAMLWYVIDGDRVIWKGMNWADNFKEPGGEKIGFETLQLMEYAGDGKWKSEEDWWIAYEMQRFAAWYAEFGEPYNPSGDMSLTRDDWGDWVDWARPAEGHAAKPSWLGKKGLKPTFSLKDIDFGVRNPSK
jgi:hypothetical protein